MSSEHGVKAIYYALFANLGIAVAKGIATFFTMSGSMLAETIHSLADCINQLLLLFGLKSSKRAPDSAHPLGYGKDIYFWSFVVALMLFSIGGLFSIYEGIHKINSHEPIQKVWIALTVLGVSIVLEVLSLIGAIKEINKLKKDKPFFTWLNQTRNSELIVVLGEDTAAVFGLVIAFIFVSLSDYLNMPVLDAIGSIAIGVILLCISFFLIFRMKALLIGKSANPEVQDQIEKTISEGAGVEKVLNILTIQNGPYVMLAAKIKMDRNINIEEACKKINTIEIDLKNRFPSLEWSFIEPDIK